MCNKRPTVLRGVCLFSMLATASIGCMPAPEGGSAAGDAGASGGAGGPGTGGAGTGGIAGSVGGGLGGAAIDAGVSSAASACVESPPPLRPTGVIVEFPIEIALGGKTLVFGEPNALAAGGTLTPQDMRFYLSQAALLRGDGTSVPVDIVTQAGTPEPYGIHFFNGDDVASHTMRVLAPAGNYTAVTFLWGLTLACNQGDASQLHAPLSDTSQMTWPHLFGGYLFFKYGASIMQGLSDAGAPSAPQAAIPSLIHMGGSLTMNVAPAIQVNGMLTVLAGGSVVKIIRVVLDEVFKGAAMNVDLMDFVVPPGGGDEITLGERLRRSTSGLKIFVFGS